MPKAAADGHDVQPSRYQGRRVTAVKRVEGDLGELSCLHGIAPAVGNAVGGGPGRWDFPYPSSSIGICASFYGAKNKAARSRGLRLLPCLMSKSKIE